MVFEYDLNEILPRLVGPLQEIVNRELAAGSTIEEISSKWPMPKVNVWFARPLTDKYLVDYPTLSYDYLGDPKNWLEHYIDRNNEAMVAAKFSKYQDNLLLQLAVLDPVF